MLGTVRDASGGAVPKAAVTLINQDTNIQTRTTTDENGNFDFFNVRVGRYTVTVEHAGFSKASATDIAVNVNARQRVDLTHAGRRGDRIRRGRRARRRRSRPIRASTAR